MSISDSIVWTATNRRTFLAGLSALGLAALLPARATAMEAGGGFLTTARDKLTGKFLVVRVGADLEIQWEAPLPSRAHGITLAPDGRSALAAARRPGRFVRVFDVEEGDTLKTLEPAPGRHFYGHAVFGADGRHVYMTENAFEEGTGVIGVYDAADGYKRIGEFSSGGVGPHQLALMPDGRTLVVANGGIRTHPDSKREKLNLDVMRSSLTLLDTASGKVVHDARLPLERDRLLSLRHLALDGSRIIVVAQDQAQDLGQPLTVKPLAFVFDADSERKELVALPASGKVTSAFGGYCGSVAADAATGAVAVTSPIGGVVALWRRTDGDYKWLGDVTLADVCGADTGPLAPGCIVTSGVGDVRRLDGQGRTEAEKAYPFRQWDNHLTALA